jgi:hypothetical protein
MKINTFLVTMLIVFLCLPFQAMAQEIIPYDFLEVIVVQKANNRGKIKRIRLEEQPSLEGKQITVDAIEDIKGTSQLLNYMNRTNWEFLERQAIVSEENDPVWMSYIFRKQIIIKKPL